MKDYFRQFSRNFRWGTCADCPQIGDQAFPELCKFTDRYDHKLDIDALAEKFKNERKWEEL